MGRCLLLLDALFWLGGPTIGRARQRADSAHLSNEDDIVRVQDNFGR